MYLPSNMKTAFQPVQAVRELFMAPEVGLQEGKG